MAEVTKEVIGVNTLLHELDLSEDEAAVSMKKGTGADRQNMWRMGKVQELRRNFRFVSIFGFSMILMACWEIVLSTSGIGLTNGGTGGLIWTYLFSWMGFICVTISMAEMGSMAPTSGGQYHWISEFAPARAQKFLSYVIGWLCTLGWQVSSAGAAFLAGVQIQGLIVINKPDYVFQAWHGTLLVIAVSAFNVTFNTFFAKKLPLIEAVILVLHICGFFAVLAVLWVMGPIADASIVFTTFNNFGGWSSKGLATIVGAIGTAMPLIGADASVHLSEELRDASKTLPRAMIWSILVNGAMGWIIIITYCCVLGNVEDALESPTRQPFLYVFQNTTKSAVGASLMGAVVISMATFSAVSVTATSSRQLFAFARDKGVPFHETFAYVPPEWDVPINAVCFSFAVACLLSLINLGSAVAFNTIASLGSAALMSSYIVSISCMALKRIRGEPLLPSEFKLGRTGLPINLISLVFLIFIFFFSFWPGMVKPTVELMNWSSMMFGGTMIFALLFYFFRGRHVYDGPVTYVRKSA
ncbi:amino acid transporter [Lindgomyces ingoldianus]|uniref:Amino acid transporter n=1 Tax=Lindgomyces ingoldianus TaxID=673940 RepID=A0ACB6R7K1_9PLEO|nr:amino acid transporter [Lindgomyces ingoldianus]KAF2475067.1 amino acid transporter [Lindgomyces ingoldianus]